MTIGSGDQDKYWYNYTHTKIETNFTTLLVLNSTPMFTVPERNSVLFQTANPSESRQLTFLRRNVPLLSRVVILCQEWALQIANNPIII
jgi:hypothetical protein